MALARTLVLLLLSAFVLVPARGQLQFTGDASADFSVLGIALNDDSATPDVGMPSELAVTSGWDVKRVFFYYDPSADELHVGIETFEIAGDADTIDHDADATSTVLAGLGGADLADLTGGESVALLLDFNGDVAANGTGAFDYVLGVPGGDPALGDPLTCANFAMTYCLGLYAYLDLPTVAPAFRFARLLSEYAVTNRNPKPTLSQPHLEWTLHNVTGARSATVPSTVLAADNRQAWSFSAQLYSGSNADGPIGEDFAPSANSIWTVMIPCTNLDVCGVCNGNGSSCADCKGIPLGSTTYDACGVCDGNGTACADCAGVPNGNSTYDKCGVCNGGDKSCRDCLGVVNGPAKFDGCGICNGNNQSCADCAGSPNGRAKYDLCDVCNGDNSACIDCAGVRNGKSKYDACGVCAGDNSTCSDCAGRPNGPSAYDTCGVCGGDSSTCKDCTGVPRGPAVYDLCDVCNGDGTRCLDCAGVPNGALVYDSCGVCGGDSSKCSDCAGTPNGGAIYDRCGVCNGNGLSCVDCWGVPHGSAAYDQCDVCGGSGSSCLDCFGVPHGGATVDDCGECGGDGTRCRDCLGTPYGQARPDACGVCQGDNSTCTCTDLFGCPLVEVDRILLEWTIYAIADKVGHTVDILSGIKEELCRYNVEKGAIAGEMADYLDTANEFREVLDNFIYVNTWLKGALAPPPANKDSLNLAKTRVVPPRIISDF